MATFSDISRRVMEIVIRSPGCDVDELVLKCPDLTWNQVFLELDRLSREGRFTLKQKGPGLYSVTSSTDVAVTVEAIHSQS